MSINQFLSRLNYFSRSFLRQSIIVCFLLRFTYWYGACWTKEISITYVTNVRFQVSSQWWWTLTLGRQNSLLLPFWVWPNTIFGIIWFIIRSSKQCKWLRFFLCRKYTNGVSLCKIRIQEITVISVPWEDNQFSDGILLGKPESDKNSSKPDYKLQYIVKT